MSKFKRVISGLVGVAIAASMFTSMPFSVFAEDKTETNNQTYVYDDYEVSYQVTNSWGDTEVVSVTLSNTGDNTIEDWMLYFDPNGECSIRSIVSSRQHPMESRISRTAVTMPMSHRIPRLPLAMR